MSLTTAGLAVAQVAAIVAIGWVTGQVLLGWAFGPRLRTLGDQVGVPERALAAVVGFVAFAAALTGANFLLSGTVFGSEIPVVAAGVLVLGLGLRMRTYPRAVPWLRVAGFGAVLFLLFILPPVIGGTGVRTGDPPWHLGWSEQLLAGEPVPTGPAPEYARNAYPWGWHGALATLVRLVPGSDPLIAQEALHVLVVAAIPLAAACLARRINMQSGWPAAAAVALIGGWGWIAAGEPAFITVPRTARYGADLVVASPNSAYELFPPAFPRELGLVLVAAVGVYLAIAWREPDRRRAGLVAGILLGLVGLVSIPMLVTGTAWVCAGVAVAPRGSRFRLLGLAIVGTLATMSAWLVPLVVNYIRFGGFVNVTPRLGVEWPFPTALWSWGLLLPLAVTGVAVAARARRTAARFLLAFTTGSLIMLALAVARREFGWEVAGNATLLHQGRVWPPVHLLGAAFGGFAMLTAYERISARRIAVGLCAVVLVVGSISPWFASRHLTAVIEKREGGFIYTRPDLARGSFVRDVAGRLGPHDVVLVEGSDLLALMVFQFSGARLAQYENENLAGNDLRIRFADLAEAWNERMASGGFVPNYVLVPASDAPTDARPLLTGQFGATPETWVLFGRAQRVAKSLSD